LLDVEKGYWKGESSASSATDHKNLSSGATANFQKVIPYVQDFKNCLLFKPALEMNIRQLASLQAALKAAIQVKFQLEENELAAEPLPEPDNRKLILFYEAAEGGAGVLRRLLQEQDALPEVAKIALELCHFNPETGEDLQYAPLSGEQCEAACYDCLMNYGNQKDHELLDRKSIADFLLKLASSRVAAAPSNLSREEHLTALLKNTDSELERQWLMFLEEKKYRLPSHAQYFIPECKTRPDFFYARYHTAIYIDGPHHKYPERKERDKIQQECMEDMGYTVLRFTIEDEWDVIIKKYPHIFGVVG